MFRDSSVGNLFELKCIFDCLDESALIQLVFPYPFKLNEFSIFIGAVWFAPVAVVAPKDLYGVRQPGGTRRPADWIGSQQGSRYSG